MYPHGGSGNHGCEAIVRSTVKLVGNETTLFTNKMEEDYKAGLQDLCELDVAEKPIKSGSLSHLFAIFRNKVLGQADAFDRLVFQHIVETAKKTDCVLGIGGDNYCYDTPEFIYLVNRMVDEAKVKRILWGASVDPEAIDERMLQDLRGYYKIWARESLTYQALLDKGLTQTFLLPDPAFVLDRKDLPLPDGFVEGNTVGINVSPMIIGYEKNRGMTLQNYVHLIQHIIDETDLQILRTLQKNAKLTTKELADKVHLTPTPVFERQKRLERRGYIKKYVAVLDADKMGLGLQVFCKVKLKQINHEIADAFTRRILRIPEVTECYNTSGAYDYLLKVRAKDMKQYQDFVLNKLGDIESLSSIESTFVMSEVKQNYGINI